MNYLQIEFLTLTFSIVWYSYTLFLSPYFKRSFKYQDIQNYILLPKK